MGAVCRTAPISIRHLLARVNGPGDLETLYTHGPSLRGVHRKGNHMYTRLLSALNSERGASMVEYALLVVLIAIVALLAVVLAGEQVSTTYSEIASAVTQ